MKIKNKTLSHFPDYLSEFSSAFSSDRTPISDYMPTLSSSRLFRFIRVLREMASLPLSLFLSLSHTHTHTHTHTGARACNIYKSDCGRFSVNFVIIHNDPSERTFRQININATIDFRRTVPAASSPLNRLLVQHHRCKNVKARGQQFLGSLGVELIQTYKKHPTDGGGEIAPDRYAYCGRVCV